MLEGNTHCFASALHIRLDIKCYNAGTIVLLQWWCSYAGEEGAVSVPSVWQIKCPCQHAVGVKGWSNRGTLLCEDTLANKGSIRVTAHR